jgi:hypothetical protein
MTATPVTNWISMGLPPTRSRRLGIEADRLPVAVEKRRAAYPAHRDPLRIGPTGIGPNKFPVEQVPTPRRPRNRRPIRRTAASGRGDGRRPGGAAAGPLRGPPDDDYLIVLAQAGDAALFSGDENLLELAGRIPVFTPAEFLAAHGG